MKLVYLADVKSCRDRGERITNLEWIVHLYGPWTHEYDPLLAEMEKEDLIQVRGDYGAGDATFVNPIHLVDIEKISLPVSTYLAVRQDDRKMGKRTDQRVRPYPPRVDLPHDSLRLASRGVPFRTDCETLLLVELT